MSVKRNWKLIPIMMQRSRYGQKEVVDAFIRLSAAKKSRTDSHYGGVFIGMTDTDSIKD